MPLPPLLQSTLNICMSYSTIIVFKKHTSNIFWMQIKIDYSAYWLLNQNNRCWSFLIYPSPTPQNRSPPQVVQNRRKSMKSARRNIFLLISRKTNLNKACFETYSFRNKCTPYELLFCGGSKLLNIIVTCVLFQICFISTFFILRTKWRSRFNFLVTITATRMLACFVCL